jgi:hypothetical protein
MGTSDCPTATACPRMMTSTAFSGSNGLHIPASSSIARRASIPLRTPGDNPICLLTRLRLPGFRPPRLPACTMNGLGSIGGRAAGRSRSATWHL